ncbi:MAG: hypothetical protein H0Z19_04225 [Archaeoglobus sp.]|uniref:hypothetical protein n=1 Tax=Archaeoglobus sp. TaxID=1872626 RepID=UPI001DA9241D|nr:hypothetical protein [Archaeoglobus sp.]MBO8179674.1 hypothetical protein [Archaeoglobus sp.]
MIEVLSVEVFGGFNAVAAPQEVCLDFLNRYRSRFPALYVCGNRSKVLDGVRGNFGVRRGFTIHQVIEILLNAYQDTVFIEHDAMLFEDCDFHTLEDFVMLLRQIGRDRTVVYFTTKRDRIFDFITTLADRYILVEAEEGGYFIADVDDEGITQRFYPKRAGQLTLEVF